MKRFLLSACIIVSALSINAQTINSISPNSGVQGQTLLVSISGTNMYYVSQWSGTLSEFRFSQWSGSNMFYGNSILESGDTLYGDVSISNGQSTGDYDLEVLDQNTGNWVMLNNAFEIIAELGCTDMSACNYNSSANDDDGSCDLPNGCGDPLYLEYDSLVTCSDANACVTLTVNGCTDMSACNYDSLANTIDNTCVYPTTSIDTQVACNSYYWNGVNYTSTGVYDSTFTNSLGCDSIATLNLTINYSDTTISSVITCDSLVFNSQLITQSGSYTFNLTNVEGCDSIHTINLTINNSITLLEFKTACDSYTWNDSTYEQSGIYSYNGEENNYALKFDGFDDYINFGDKDEFSINNSTNNNGWAVSFWLKLDSGATALQNILNKQGSWDAGAYHYEYQVLTRFNSKIRLIIFGGDDANSYQIIDIDTALSSDNWHHIAFTFDLGATASTSLNAYLNGVQKSDGNGATTFQSTTWAPSLNTASPLYLGRNASTDYGQFELDELSIWDTELTQLDIDELYNGGTPCDIFYHPILSELLSWWRHGDGSENGNGSIVYDKSSNGNNGTIDGAIFTDNSALPLCILTNTNGCDTTATLDLTIYPSTTSTTTEIACDDYTWNGQTYTSSGVYTFASTNANGCDSSATLDLTINPSTTSNSTVTECDSYSWNGTTYTASGVYTFVSTISNGCDSTSILHLTINPSTTSSSTVTECDTYSWNGQAYTTSGVYTFTTTNSNGCDSTATLHLTINTSPTSTTNVTECNTYSWNDSTYTISGIYTFVITNSIGCDSIANLNLTINPSPISSTNVTECDTYSWNGTTYTLSGSYAYNTLNSNGCDSTATLNLTINQSTTSTSNVTECDTYFWNGQVYTTSGVYTFVNAISNGCDSTVTLNLTISPTSTLFDTVSICKGSTYIVLNSAYTNSGDYIDSIVNSNGCFSFIYTNLSVGNPLSVTISQVGSVLESTVSGGFMPYDYLWNNSATTPNITISSNGLYWLLVTDSLSCPNDTAFYDVTDFHTSISELGVDALSIYPNPSSNLFNIEFTSYIKQSLVVRLVNVIGGDLLKDILADFEGDYKKTIDLSSYSKGIYFLKIETNSGIINKKLILQ